FQSVAGERDDITDPKASVTKQQDHALCSAPFVRCSAELITRQKNLSDFFLGIGLLWPWLDLRRFHFFRLIRIGPFAADTETEKVPQDGELFCPGHRGNRSLCAKQINRLDFDIVEPRDVSSF